MKTWTIEPAAEAFPKFRALWDEVNAANGNHLLLDAIFVETLIESFARPTTLLAVAEQDSNPALLLLEPGGHGFWNTFQPAHAPLGLALFSQPDQVVRQLRELLQALPGLTLGIGIGQQDPDYSVLAMDDSVPQFERVSYIDTGRITLADRFEEYWATRPKELRDNLARRRRRLEREGQKVTLVEFRQQRDVPVALGEYARMEQRGWKATQGTAVRLDNEQGRFYAALLERFCAIGEGVIYQLRFNDRPVASQLCIERDDSMSISLKIAYDEAARRAAPGFLLQQEIIRRLHETGKVRVIEFYGRATEGWTRKWTDEIRPICHINVYRNSGMRAAYRLARSRMRNVRARSVESLPPGGSGVANGELRWSVQPIAEFDQVRDEWDSLNRRTANSPLLDFDFFRLGLKHFGHGDEAVAICRSGGLAVAAGVFFKNSVRSWCTFQPAQAPLGAWLHDPQLPIQTLLQSLSSALSNMTLVVALTQQDPAFTPRPDSGDRLSTIDYIETARLSIDRPFDEYWQSRSKNLKQNTRRQRNRLSREGIVTALDIITSPDQTDRVVRDYGLMESAGWKGEQGTAVHPDNVQGRFYRELLRHYLERNEATVYRYRYGDHLVSTDLNVHRDGIMILLKTTYDESQTTTSPTMLMRYDIYKDLFDNESFRSVEYYGRVMGWHRKWTDELRTMYHVNYYKLRLLKGIAGLVRGA